MVKTRDEVVETMTDKRIIITGGSGALGKELRKVFPEAIAPTHHELDVSDKDMVREYFEWAYPDIVIHTAAIIDARICETQWQRASKVNVGGTYNIAAATRDCGAKLVHLSTACVFDGESGPFTETSKPSPKNFYALTKFSAEQVVQAIEGNYLIVRTNFVSKEPWKYPSAFMDRFGSYLFAADVAYGIKIVINQGLDGIVHVCGDRRMSMFELAQMTTPDIKPMLLDEYQGPPVCRDMTLTSLRIKPFRIGEH